MDSLCARGYILIPFVAELQIDSLCGKLQTDSLCARGYTLIPLVAEEGRVWPWGKGPTKKRWEEGKGRREGAKIHRNIITYKAQHERTREEDIRRERASN